MPKKDEGKIIVFASVRVKGIGWVDEGEHEPTQALIAAAKRFRAIEYVPPKGKTGTTGGNTNNEE